MWDGWGATGQDRACVAAPDGGASDVRGVANALGVGGPLRVEQIADGADGRGTPGTRTHIWCISLVSRSPVAVPTYRASKGPTFEPRSLTRETEESSVATEALSQTSDLAQVAETRVLCALFRSLHRAHSTRCFVALVVSCEERKRELEDDHGWLAHMNPPLLMNGESMQLCSLRLETPTERTVWWFVYERRQR